MTGATMMSSWVRSGGTGFDSMVPQDTQLDESYHYPPELLELLCDAIPALFRSKRGVIDFFAGCGAGNSLVNEWRVKLRQDPDGVRKHEIARAVVCGLNDAGDAALK